MVFAYVCLMIRAHSASPGLRGPFVGPGGVTIASLIGVLSIFCIKRGSVRLSLLLVHNRIDLTVQP